MQNAQKTQKLTWTQRKRKSYKTREVKRKPKSTVTRNNCSYVCILCTIVVHIAKQRCVMGVGMCLYAQLVQMKNKQYKSAIILQCYHLHLSDFCSRPQLTQPYNHIIYPGADKIYLVFFWKCQLYLLILLFLAICSIHLQFWVQKKIFWNHSDIYYILILGCDLWLYYLAALFNRSALACAHIWFCLVCNLNVSATLQALTLIKKIILDAFIRGCDTVT